MQPIVMDASTLAPFEIAARLEVLISYPGIDGGRATEIVQALCAEQVEALIEQDPARRRELIDRYPAYRRRLARASTANIPRYRENALRAGYTVLPHIYAEAGHIATFAGVPGVPSEAELIRRACAQFPGEQADLDTLKIRDFRKRQIRRRAPVIHLAAAYANAALGMYTRKEPLTFEYQDLDFHRSIVATATKYAEFVEKAPGLKWAHGQLFELRWTE